MVRCDVCIQYARHCHEWLEGLRMLEHGGNLNEAMALFAHPPGAWLDLSTGINPQSYSVPPMPPEMWHRLPESDAEFVTAARLYYQASQLLPVAGSQAAIQALPRLRAMSRVVVGAPSYAEHAYRWRLGGHAVREVDYSGLDAAVDECDVMVVCNPNNPTGAMLDTGTLLGWAERLGARQGWLVVDEAFMDVTPMHSMAPWSQQPGLIVLRSIGKFFGLAGLRLGFVAANDTLLAQLADFIGPWGVTAAAQFIGGAALADSRWQAAMRRYLLISGKRLHDLLARHGIQASGTALYQWWPETQAELFLQHMARQAIWVRRFACGTSGIRLGVPFHESDWQRLQQALESWINRGIDQ
jgi:cobalamin biosynthetic protein CobC